MFVFRSGHGVSDLCSGNGPRALDLQVSSSFCRIFADHLLCEQGGGRDFQHHSRSSRQQILAWIRRVDQEVAVDSCTQCL